MFDDLTKQPGQQSVEDIFSETEVLPPSLPPRYPAPPRVPAAPTPVLAPPPPVPPTNWPLVTSGGGHKGLIIAASVIILLVIAGVAYWYWLRPLTTTPAPVDQPTNLPSESNITNQPVIEPATNSELEDTDGDRLSTQQEFELGTDPNNPDSDNDGLFDGEEVLIYHTNPLNNDSDGDGYTDGAEVQNNYDPNGPGRLLNLPSGELNFQEINSLLKQIDQETT